MSTMVEPDSLIELADDLQNIFTKYNHSSNKLELMQSRMATCDSLQILTVLLKNNKVDLIIYIFNNFAYSPTIVLL